MNQDNSQTPALKCNQCGSDLIMTNIQSHQKEGSFSAVVTTSYRCSNDTCQKEIDKRKAKRIELRNEQELARQRRLNKQTATKTT